MFLILRLIDFRIWTDSRIFPRLRKIVLPDAVVDNSCEGTSNGFSHHFNEFGRDTVGVSRRIRSQQFQHAQDLAWGTSRSLKLAGLSAGRDSNKRTNVRNSFKKDFFKLISNSVLGKTMENILKTVYLKNVIDKKHYQNIARSQLMCHQKFLMRI